MPPVSLHLLSAPGREAVLAGTLASWAATDWGETRPRLHLDAATTGPAHARIPAAWLAMLRAALADADADHAPHLLLLEDDLAFHPRLRAALLGWPPLHEGRIATLASLYNPGLPRVAGTTPEARAFAAAPLRFTGAQALLLTRPFARHVVAEWESVGGMQSQRLAQLSARDFPAAPLWVHRPSLVQHTATHSAWSAPLHRAPDFNPAWLPSA